MPPIQRRVMVMGHEETNSITYFQTVIIWGDYNFERAIRYSQFYNMYSQLAESDLRHVRKATFPGKHIFGKFTTEKLEKRAAKLNRFMCELVRCELSPKGEQALRKLFQLEMSGDFKLRKATESVDTTVTEEEHSFTLDHVQQSHVMKEQKVHAKDSMQHGSKAANNKKKSLDDLDYITVKPEDSGKEEDDLYKESVYSNMIELQLGKVDDLLHKPPQSEKAHAFVTAPDTARITLVNSMCSMAKSSNNMGNEANTSTFEDSIKKQQMKIRELLAK